MKSFKKLVSVLATFLLISLTYVGAADIDQTSKDVNSQVFNVCDSDELSKAVKKASKNDIIHLKNDICLDTTLTMDHSLCLDLGGHTISVCSDSTINIGKKVYSHMETGKVRCEGGYTREMAYVSYFDKNGQMHSGIELRWVPEKDCTEPRANAVYIYDNDVDVLIKNGTICKNAAKNGRDGGLNVSCGYDGSDGETPSATISVMSGNLRLDSVIVKGADGGSGGNGGYQSLWHVPFGGGKAGNGGNGGSGGAAIVAEYGHGKFIDVSRSKICRGKPGKGGKAGIPNPNYWIYRGWSGKDGQDGK